MQPGYPSRTRAASRIGLVSTNVLASLIAELPDGMVVTDPAVTEGYRQDRAFDPSAGKPLAVVRPQRTEEVQTLTALSGKGGFHRGPTMAKPILPSDALIGTARCPTRRYVENPQCSP